MRLRALLAGLLVPITLWVLLPVGTLGQSRLSDIEERIESAQSRIERKRGTERVLTTEISRYNARIGALQGSITTLTAKVTRLQTDLDRKRALLSRIQSDLRYQRARLVRLRARLIVARRTLSRRLVEIYQSDSPDLISVIVNSKGFADLIEREDFLRRIGEQDRRIIELVATAKQDATASEAKLEGLEKRQRAITAEVFEQRNEIAEAREELVDQRSGYRSQRDRRAAVLGSVRGERRSLEGELDDLEAQEAKIRNALAAAAGNIPAGPIRAGSGSMVWPVNGTVTGVFGEPRPGRLHQGLDIAAAEGTPIVAADSGTVSLIQGIDASGGYGNFTCVTHRSGLSSCYAHQSRFGTTAGARVSRGEVIGYVGNTGRSFGAHLHFEVRPGGGTAVNPMNYL